MFFKSIIEWIFTYVLEHIGSKFVGLNIFCVLNLLLVLISKTFSTRISTNFFYCINFEVIIKLLLMYLTHLLKILSKIKSAYMKFLALTIYFVESIFQKHTCFEYTFSKYVLNTEYIPT